nr:MAG TPA: hypothetical protein [Caudoviricetes sp.]
MKTVKLSPCEENKFPDIPDLKFYRTEGDLFYFDAAQCLSKADPTANVSVEDFLSKFDHLIGSLCENNAIVKDELTVTDDSGAIYLDECLVIPFLAYLDRSFGGYVIERMEELLMYGFTINDSFCRFFHKARFGDTPLAQL